MAYDKVQFITYNLDTSAAPAALGEARQNIDARLALLSRALNQAAANTGSPPDESLKVLVTPQQFLGCYSLADAAYALHGVQQLLATPCWQHWALVISLQAQSESAAPMTLCLVQLGAAVALGQEQIAQYLTAWQGGRDLSASQRLGQGYLLAKRAGEGLNLATGATFNLAEIQWGLELADDGGQRRAPLPPALPGQPGVQLQLALSCGLDFRPQPLAVLEGGLVCHCDGAGFGSGLWRLENGAASALTGQAPEPVSDAPIELGSPLASLPVSSLYPKGAGKLRAFTPQPLPPAAPAPGQVQTFNWQVSEQAKLDLTLFYDQDGQFLSAQCQAALPGVNLAERPYRLPLNLCTYDSQGQPVVLKLRLQSCNGLQDLAINCNLDLPHFKFSGIAMVFCSTLRGDAPAPITAWKESGFV
ncbi:MAG: hypothetical protein VX447_05355 [Pseudomonadota bacterium]|nr:hypothetical protein [Pseudomonadota bacterium]